MFLCDSFSCSSLPVSLVIQKFLPLIVKWEWGTTGNFLYQFQGEKTLIITINDININFHQSLIWFLIGKCFLNSFSNPNFHVYFSSFVQHCCDARVEQVNNVHNNRKYLVIHPAIKCQCDLPLTYVFRLFYIHAVQIIQLLTTWEHIKYQFPIIVVLIVYLWKYLRVTVP